jgi:hypothetical protein
MYWVHAMGVAEAEKRKVGEQFGRPNPNAKPAAEGETKSHAIWPNPDMVQDWRQDAKQVFALLSLLLAFIIIQIVGFKGLTALALPATVFGLLGLVVLVGPMLMFALGRYPGSITTSRTLLIRAAPEAVWNTVRLQKTVDYYRPTVARIERLPETPNAYRCYSRTSCKCANCTLARAPDRYDNSQIAHIVELIEGRREIVRCGPLEQKSPFQKGISSEIETWDLVPVDGGTLVTRCVVTQRPRLWAAVMIKTLDLPGLQLADLKTYLEGSKPTGRIAALRRELEAAKIAPMHCGCA